MATSLGALGVQHDQVAAADGDLDSFDWFENNRDDPEVGSIRLQTELDELELVDFFEVMTATASEGPQAMVAVKNGFRMVIDPRDFDRFWSTAKQHRQKVEDMLGVWQLLMETVTNRPTQQSSDSSVGRLPTAPSSPAASISPVSPGRPDLALVQYNAELTRQEVEAEMAAQAG